MPNREAGRSDRRPRRAHPQRRFGLTGLVGVAALAVVLHLYTPLPSVAIYLAAVSVVAFLLCGYDKRVAGGEVTRVPENVLFGVALVGGSPGLLLGMRVFRHKTKKVSFRAVVAVILVLQAAALYGAWHYGAF